MLQAAIKTLVIHSTLLAASALAQSKITPTFSAIAETILKFEQASPGKTLTVDRVLSSLPQSYRSSFSLMYGSRSAQESSFSNPRVIMFGDNARTIITFNGHVSQRGYSRLEFASVNPNTNEIEFRFIEFPRSDVGIGQVKLSEPNPENCMTCHGPSPHYIWDQYALWRGAYGSRDDVLDLSPDERDQLTKFRNESRNQPRYRHLVYEFADLSPSAPFRPKFDHVVDPQDRGDFQLAIEFRPNARLGMLMVRHQARARLVRIAAHPQFNRLKFGLAFFLAGCEQIGIPSTDELIRAFNLDDYFAYATALDSDPRVHWRFSLERSDDFETSQYFAGIWEFRGLLQTFLWQEHLSKVPSLKPFHKPYAFAPVVLAIEDYKFAISPRGQNMWHAFDQEGLTMPRLLGFGEADFYLSRSALADVVTSREVAAMCDTLAQLQMEQLGWRDSQEGTDFGWH